MQSTPKPHAKSQHQITLSKIFSKTNIKTMWIKIYHTKTSKFVSLQQIQCIPFPFFPNGQKILRIWNRFLFNNILIAGKTIFFSLEQKKNFFPPLKLFFHILVVSNQQHLNQQRILDEVFEERTFSIYIHRKVGCWIFDIVFTNYTDLCWKRFLLYIRSYDLMLVTAIGPKNP